MQFPYPGGDGNWYQVLSIESATSLTLASAYQGQTTAATTFRLGQTPAILEDFHDLLVYRPLTIYFSTIQSNPQKFEEYTKLYDDGIQMLDNYAGEKVVNVDLGGRPQPINPNLFIYKS